MLRKKLHGKQMTGCGSTKLNSTRLVDLCMFFDDLLFLVKNVYFIRSGIRMISSGDISLNLKMLHVS